MLLALADMGGFAFDSTLLHAPHLRNRTLWQYAGRVFKPPLPRANKAAAPQSPGRIEWRGGETEFLQELLGPHRYPEDLQPLANCAHDILVLHNGLVAPPPAAPAARGRAGRERKSRAWRPTVRPPVPCKEDGWSLEA